MPLGQPFRPEAGAFRPEAGGRRPEGKAGLWARLRKLWRLSSDDRRLLVKSGVLLVITKIVLCFLPFSMVRRFLSPRPPASGLRPDSPGLRPVLWSVKTAGRFLLREQVCLAEAITAKLLLNRRGFASSLRIGVLKDEEGNFKSHAWLESNGVILIGGPENEISRYTEVPLTADR